MVRVYRAKTFIECTDRLKEDLLARQAGLDISHVVIVPDKYTLEAEKMLYEGGSGAFDLEVMTFRRLALNACAGRKFISRQGAIAKIAKIIYEHEQDFVSFSKATGKKGFAKNIFDTISQLKSCGIAPTDISGGDTAAMRKMSDIKLIFTEYEQYLEGAELMDAAGVLSALRQDFEKNKRKSTHYYLCGFYSMTRQMYDIVRAMAFSAASLTVFTVADDANPILYNYEHLDNLSKALSGCKCEHIEISGRRMPFSELSGTFYTAAGGRHDGGRVTVFEAEDIIGELLYISRDILYRIKKEGIRWRDAVIVLNQPVYDIVNRILGSYDIPFYIDRKQNLLRYPLSQFIIKSVQAVRNRFRRAEVMQIVKNPFFRCAADDKRCFENFVLEHNIDFDGFFQSFDNIEHKDTYLRKCAERARAAIIKYIVPFGKRISAAEYAKEYEQAVLELLAAVNADDALKTLSETDDFAGQVFERTADILSQLSEVLCKVDSEVYLYSLENALSGTEISVIPQSSDAVVIADASAFINYPRKVMYIAGLNEGLLPYAKSDIGLISDKDISELKECSGLDVAPKVKAVNTESRNMLFYSLTAAESLVASYSLSDLAGDTLKPSVFLWQLTARLDGYKEEYQSALDRAVFDDRLFAAASKEAAASVYKDIIFKYLGNERGAKHYYLSAARKYADGQLSAMPHLASVLADKCGGSEDKFLNLPQETPSLAGSPLTGDKIRVTQLEEYFSCPYRHFIKYGLKASERKDGRITVADSGNLLHSIFQMYAAEGMYVREPEEVLTELFDSCLKLYPVWGREENRTRLDMLKRIALRALKELRIELTETDYKVEACEAQFDVDGKYPPMTVQAGGREYTVAGRIDRIDTYGSFARVVDYKSGRLDDGDSKGYYSGLGIQPFIYLEALKKAGYYPSGAFYHKIEQSFLKKADKLLTGAYIYDPDIAASMDKGLAPGARSRILGARLTKDGALYSLKNQVQTMSDMAKLTAYSRLLAAKALSEIEGGNIEASPAERACRFCLGRQICSFDSENGKKRISPAITYPEIAAIAAQEEGGDE